MRSVHYPHPPPSTAPTHPCAGPSRDSCSWGRSQSTIVYASRPSQSHTLDVAASPPTFPPPAEEYRPGPGSDCSYDPGLLPHDTDYTVAVTLTHLLHCPDK
eukprot:1812655-Pleurochrysis_carterae.AAC.1